MSRAALLTVHGLTVARRRVLLRDVTLQVLPGEHWCIVGRNGGGKTSLLGTLLGLLPPRAGRIELLPELADRRRIGFVPQEQDLLPALPCSVAEFVTAGCWAARGAPTRAAVSAALSSMGIEDLARADVRRLSLGQRRRVWIARALSRDPVLLALDEPTASLDTPTAERLVADLRVFAARGVSLLHVTHDLDLAERTATHVAVVADGRVLAGPLESMREPMRRLRHGADREVAG